MNRLLIFHYHDTAANQMRMAPAYYLQADYKPVAARIYAEDAPLRDAKFDIFAGGVSIFSNKTTKAYNLSTGVDITGANDTTIVLTAGENSEELAERFANDSIDAGTWVYANMVDSGGGKNFTVILELYPMSEGSDEDD